VLSRIIQVTAHQFVHTQGYIIPKAAGVTEIPYVDESSEWELLSLLGDCYEPESFEFVFSSIASNAVFFFT